ncbi:hypothetical protein CFP56_030378 [Quercus suber]|uniref:Uncharacterized protein n=1 Tax=Quercus suber TaxID=58331 RepID=A0AAW0JNL4_QUESU
MNLTLAINTGEDAQFFYANLIPVLNQPLEACENSEEDMESCFCFKYASDVAPKPLDPNNIYQQFEIHPSEMGCDGRGGFVAKSITSDGIPPKFLRSNGWTVQTSTRSDFQLGYASGLNTSLRACLPKFNFLLSCTSSQPVIVGKWYSPFMFIKEGTLKDQMSTSTYYEVTLEQKWAQIFACEHNERQGNVVVVDVPPREMVLVFGREVMDVNVVSGVMWFKSCGIEGQERSVGLCLEVFERKKWEQERVGWVGGNDRQLSLKRVEEFGGTSGWRKFGCYILAERFMLK